MQCLGFVVASHPRAGLRHIEVEVMDIGIFNCDVDQLQGLHAVAIAAYDAEESSSSTQDSHASRKSPYI